MVPIDHRLRRLVQFLGVVLLTLGTGACSTLDDILAKVPAFSTVRFDPAFSPYTAPRNPPEHAVPFDAPFGTAGDAPLEATEAALIAFGDSAVNPFSSTEAVLAAGEAAYQTHCYVCHGSDGRGEGPVTGPGKFPMQQSIVGPATIDRSDGYIYGVIRVGRGLMPAYGARISRDERWYIVNYVRYLQQQAQGSASAGEPASAVLAQGRE